MCAVSGGDCRAIATQARLPRWSPDGATLYYTRALPTGFALFAQPMAGGTEHCVGELRPIDGNGAFYDVAAVGRVAWVRRDISRRELWLMPMPVLH